MTAQSASTRSAVIAFLAVVALLPGQASSAWPGKPRAPKWKTGLVVEMIRFGCTISIEDPRGRKWVVDDKGVVANAIPSCDSCRAILVNYDTPPPVVAELHLVGRGPGFEAMRAAHFELAKPLKGRYRVVVVPTGRWSSFCWSVGGAPGHQCSNQDCPLNVERETFAWELTPSLGPGCAVTVKLVKGSVPGVMLKRNL